MRRLLLLTSVIVLIVISLAVSGELEKKTLKGISGFYVKVTVDPGRSTLRLRSTDIQNDVEMALRKASIPVFHEGEMMGDDLWNAATIFVSIEAQSDTLHQEKRGNCLIAHYILDVRQSARLERDTTVKVPTTTWRVSGFELCTATNSASQVRQAVGNATDKLVTDFREINPQE